MRIKTGNTHRKYNTKFKIKEEKNAKLLKKGLSLNTSSKITARVFYYLEIILIVSDAFVRFFIVPSPRRLLACASDSEMSKLT